MLYIHKSVVILFSVRSVHPYDQHTYNVDFVLCAYLRLTLTVLFALCFLFVFASTEAASVCDGRAHNVSAVQ